MNETGENFWYDVIFFNDSFKVTYVFLLFISTHFSQLYVIANIAAHSSVYNSMTLKCLGTKISKLA